MRRNILKLEEEIKNLPGSLGEDPFPLEHFLAHGLYAREIFAPKGMLIVTKLHKTEHFIFMLKGEVSILSQEGIKRIKAPCMMISPVGAKRVVYTHEDTVWINVHANASGTKDLSMLEDELIAENYDEINLPMIDIAALSANEEEV